MADETTTVAHFVGGPRDGEAEQIEGCPVEILVPLAPPPRRITPIGVMRGEQEHIVVGGYARYERQADRKTYRLG